MATTLFHDRKDAVQEFGMFHFSKINLININYFMRQIVSCTCTNYMTLSYYITFVSVVYINIYHHFQYSKG